MAIVVPAIGQQQWGDPLNNALLGLDAAIQGKADLASLAAINTQIQSVQLAAAQANTTANIALTTAQNVPGTITVNVTPPTPSVGRYWDDGTGLKRYNGTSWQPPNYYRPVSSKQLIDLTLTTASGPAVTQNAFTSSQWPPITVTVPPSGQMFVTVSGAVRNGVVGGNNTIFMYWRASGGYVDSFPLEFKSISAEQISRAYCSRRVLLTGLTPGVNVVFTPYWLASALPASGTTSLASQGQLMVEPVPY